MKLTLQDSAGTLGTLATPALNETLRVNPLGQVTMMDSETLGSVSFTVSVPPLGAAGALGALEPERLELLLLLLEDRLRRELGGGFSGLASGSTSPVSWAALGRRLVGGLLPMSADATAGLGLAGGGSEFRIGPKNAIAMKAMAIIANIPSTTTYTM